MIRYLGMMIAVIGLLDILFYRFTWAVCEQVKHLNAGAFGKV